MRAEPVHLAESAAPSDSSPLQFNELQKQKVINNLYYCLQQHYH